MGIPLPIGRYELSIFYSTLLFWKFLASQIKELSITFCWSAETGASKKFALALGSNLWVAVYKLSCFLFVLFWVTNFDVLRVKTDASEIGDVPGSMLFVN